VPGFLISNFRLFLDVVFFLVGESPASDHGDSPKERIQYVGCWSDVVFCWIPVIFVMAVVSNIHPEFPRRQRGKNEGKAIVCLRRK